jgi:hypothetical protein
MAPDFSSGICQQQNILQQKFLADLAGVCIDKPKTPRYGI